MKTNSNQSIEAEAEITLSPLKVKQLSEQPILDGFIAPSKDGKWFIANIGIRQLFPMNYLEKVVDTARQRQKQAEK